MVGSINTTTAGITNLSASETAQQAADLNFNSFLKLLTTQLQNQDPLKPLEGTEFTAQLAQFSQLEQQIRSNANLENLVSARDYGAQTLAVSYIGKEVLAPAAAEKAQMTINKPTKGEYDFGFKLNDAAYKAKIEIRTPTGDLVRTLNGDTGKGMHTLTWDGKDEEGNLVDAGKFNIQIEAIKADGTKVAHTLYDYAEVNAVMADGSDITLNFISGKSAKFDTVQQVRSAN